MKLWNYREYFVYPQELIDNVANLKEEIATIFSNESSESLESELGMFNNAIRLTNDGINVTHRCINTSITSDIYTNTKTLFTQREEDIYGLKWFVINASDNTLVDSNTNELVGTILTLDDVYTLLGLTVYQEEEFNG